MSAGPVVAMVWEGLDAVKTGRAMLGATNPLASSPGELSVKYLIYERISEVMQVPFVVTMLWLLAATSAMVLTLLRTRRRRLLCEFVHLVRRYVSHHL